ncbi:hypothetical protein GCM10010451_49070 [Streptomyces virens]|uniref:Lipoprotein n=1 Tax=Streptomyces virens TaxID=285572 RepID=A0ABP6Q1M9_9ACTN|nr:MULTISPECIES: hypothetical protein [Streptomyces]MBA8975125.1 hypothetical protein [Streptomyces calvus]MYS25952.1 hypothetical protein [Streptomyces sp. SID7804]
MGLVSMRKTAASFLSLVVLLGAGACSTDNDSKQETATESTCEKLLGEAGVEWVKNNTVGETGVSPDSDTLESAKSLFHKQARSWKPSTEEVPTFSNSELCQVVKTGSPSGESLSIRYGASVVPFDHPFDQDSPSIPARTVTPINTDVKLVHGKDSKEKSKYYVYVRCQVEGASTAQRDEVPLEGVMTDSLTEKEAVDAHLKYLLQSARAVTRGFQCQNAPKVPLSIADRGTH